MRVLGIETSCDETAAAIVDDGRRVLADVVATQIAIHEPYGGVVPELASRHHVLNLVPVVRAAFAAAGLDFDAIDGIAVTRGPGLAGALLCGLQLAKAIAFARGLPLVGVNHLEGHLMAVFLDDGDGQDAPPFPHLALLVSGGHTALIEALGVGRYRLLGATRDDAAGECFDKVAKMLGLGYPGGVIIERLARTGDPRAVRFPRALPRRTDLDFSFSGLKTAVATHLARAGRPEGRGLNDLSASFQQAVVDVLVRKTKVALRQTGHRHLVVAGGVAANGRLREALRAMADEEEVRLYVPPTRRCTDNAAMIAAAGAPRLARGERAGLDLNAAANLPLDG
jgi:N6-L-threonylcarbamoyladenine synthase